MSDNQQPSLRTCRVCNEVKNLEEFYPVYTLKTRGKNYRQHTCKPCYLVKHSARARACRARKPEKYRAQQRNHRQKHLLLVREQRKQSGVRLKLRVFEAYGGGKCVCCSEECMTMLTIDHINNDGSQHRQSLAKYKGASVDMYRWLEREGFPEGFQVLCYNCNLSKHRNKGVCEHVTFEGSTTRSEDRSLQAIGKRSSGRRYAQ